LRTFYPVLPETVKLLCTHLVTSNYARSQMFTKLSFKTGSIDFNIHRTATFITSFERYVIHVVVHARERVSAWWSC